MNKLKIHLKTLLYLIVVMGCSVLFAIAIVGLVQLIQLTIVNIFQYITIKQLITGFIVLVTVVTSYNRIYKLLSGIENESFE